MTRRRKQPLGQTIGGILFGFEQQVLRTMPPAEELVHHARPDEPVPAGDGSLVTIELPIPIAMPTPMPAMAAAPATPDAGADEP